MLRKSKELKEIEAAWLGRKVRFYEIDALSKTRPSPLLGPYFGVVVGSTTNQALIEDRLEGNDYRHSIKFTGFLIVREKERERDAFPSPLHCEIIS